MRSYSEQRIFSRRMIDLLAQAERLVQLTPEPIPGARYLELRRHEMAHAIGRTLGLRVVDGQYGAVPHSWLEGDPVTTVLDVYAVARVPLAQLVYDPPTARVYKEGPARDDIDSVAVDFLVALFDRCRDNWQRGRSSISDH